MSPQNTERSWDALSKSIQHFHRDKAQLRLKAGGSCHYPPHWPECTDGRPNAFEFRCLSTEEQRQVLKKFANKRPAPPAVAPAAAPAAAAVAPASGLAEAERPKKVRRKVAAAPSSSQPAAVSQAAVPVDD